MNFRLCPLCEDELEVADDKGTLACRRLSSSHFLFAPTFSEATLYVEGGRLFVHYRDDGLIKAAYFQPNRLYHPAIHFDISNTELQDLIDKVELLSTFS